MEKLIITPKTKIYELLETYPTLEDILISAAPQFKKLKNPILRKTITRITTISQAAVIAGLNIEELVNTLRKNIGQDSIDTFVEEDNKYNTNCPDWFKDKNVIDTIDVSKMLNKGEQPVHEVLSRLKKLNKNEILEIVAPFIPAPLIDKSISLGFFHWLKEFSTEEYRVYFKK